MRFIGVVVWIVGLSTVGLAQEKFPATPATIHGKAVPNLVKVRGQRPPIPGGVGAGTMYKPGRLKVSSRAELQTSMIVHPNGIAVPDWIFTTATNRTELGVEVVGVYIDTYAALGVYDWSCSSAYQCETGSVPAWQWLKPFTDLPCYIVVKDDGGGHQHQTLEYVNRSFKSGGKNPTWTNTVLVRNGCTGSWDVAYSHVFRAVQRDCSVETMACGFWGPIIESFNPEPQPPINELGFRDTRLRVENKTILLGAADTAFGPPAGAWWTVFHLSGTHSWGVGNFLP